MCHPVQILADSHKVVQFCDFFSDSDKHWATFCLVLYLLKAYNKFTKIPAV